MLLSIKGLTVHYGKSLALRDVALDVDEGEFVSIIGANGSGKSTVLRIASGLKAASRGEVWFDGTRIDGKSPAAIVARGLVHVPEGRHLFPHLTVLENLKLGATLRRSKEETRVAFDQVFDLFPRLMERKDQKAGTLSGGEQQMLAIGRGLMARPRLLMLDEPSLGLAPMLVSSVGEVLRLLNEKGLSVLLVEQNVELALGAADRCYVLQVGQVVLEGSTEAIQDSDVVRRAYLGG